MNDSHWVPKKLIVLCNPSRFYVGQNAPPDEFPDLRKKLKSDIRMREAWRELSKRSRKDGHLWATGFVDYVCAFARGPRGLASLTQREAEEKLDKIIALSQEIRRECVALNLDLPIDMICGDENRALGNKLTDALDSALRVVELRQRRRARGKGANRVREPEHYRACREAWNKVEDYFGDMAYQDITALLAKLENRLEEAKPRVTILARPRHRNARVHYFVKQLNRYMLQHFGHPLRQIVADTATVVFELREPLTKDAVARMAPCERRIRQTVGFTGI